MAHTLAHNGLQHLLEQLIAVLFELVIVCLVLFVASLHLLQILVEQLAIQVGYLTERAIECFLYATRRLFVEHKAQVHQETSQVGVLAVRLQRAQTTLEQVLADGRVEHDDERTIHGLVYADRLVAEAILLEQGQTHAHKSRAAIRVGPREALEEKQERALIDVLVVFEERHGHVAENVVGVLFVNGGLLR